MEDLSFFVSGLQKGPAERGHVKKRQKSSKRVKKIFVTFRQFSRRAKKVKNRQKVLKSFSTLFDKFRAAPFSGPFWGALIFFFFVSHVSGFEGFGCSVRAPRDRNSGCPLCHACAAHMQLSVLFSEKTCGEGAGCASCHRKKAKVRANFSKRFV